MYDLFSAVAPPQAVMVWMLDVQVKLQTIVRSLSDKDMWANMFKLVRCRSASQQEVGGWCRNLFFKPPTHMALVLNFPTHGSQVK